MNNTNLRYLAHCTNKLYKNVRKYVRNRVYNPQGYQLSL